MEPSSTAPTAATPAPREVFLSDDSHVGSSELDAITRALAELILPLGGAWSELLGHEVEVEIGDIQPGPTPRPPDAEPAPGTSILDDLTGADAFVAFGVLGGELGTVALIVPTALGLVVVDVLLGGSGRPTGDRTLSAIDLDLLATVTAPTFGAVRRLGNPERFDDPVPLAVDLEEPDIEARLASGAVVTVTVTIGEHRQPLLLVVGAAAARHLAGSATTAAIEAIAGQSREVLEGVLADIVVEAVVSFPAVMVPSHRILGLDVGDVITLDTHPDQPLPLRVDGRRFADVLPARAGGDVACQVVATAIDGVAATHPVPSRPASSGPGGLL